MFRGIHWSRVKRGLFLKQMIREFLPPARLKLFSVYPYTNFSHNHYAIYQLYIRVNRRCMWNKYCNYLFSPYHITLVFATKSLLLQQFISWHSASIYMTTKMFSNQIIFMMVIYCIRIIYNQAYDCNVKRYQKLEPGKNNDIDFTCFLREMINFPVASWCWWIAKI